MTLHPATLLFAWGVLAVSLQSSPVSVLALIAAALIPVALFLARRRAWVLLRRARWLLLSIIVLFAFATPGQRLDGFAGDMGLTRDGFLLASEHVLRLALLLVSLAVVHETLGTSGMMTGLHWLLTPLAGWRALRERIVVRLMLVLDYVENAPVMRWRDWLNRDLAGPDHLELAAGSLGLFDWLVLVALGMIVLLRAGMLI
jgi:energy-coupling factor transport system permease protein